MVAVIMMSCSSSPKQEQQATADETPKPTTGEVTAMNVDLESSRVNWKGEMLGIYSHYGTVDLESASLSMQGDMVSEGEFVIDLQTMVATDENYSEDRPKERLIGHLKSPDFFDVENYPTARFVITDVSGGKVTGDLTIRGNTHSETFDDITLQKEGDTYMVTGKLIFGRDKYDVNFETGFQDRVLSDDIEIEVELVASA